MLITYFEFSGFCYGLSSQMLYRSKIANTPVYKYSVTSQTLHSKSRQSMLLESGIIWWSFSWLIDWLVYKVSESLNWQLHNGLFCPTKSPNTNLTKTKVRLLRRMQRQNIVTHFPNQLTVSSCNCIHCYLVTLKPNAVETAQIVCMWKRFGDVVWHVSQRVCGGWSGYLCW